MTDTTLCDRALLRLSGEDVRGFLQGLVTNDMTGPLPCWAGLLSPQGKALFDFIVWPDPQDDEGNVALLIDCEADHADALARRLTLYRLRRKIAIGPAAGLAVHWSLDAAGHPPDPRLAALGARWLAPPGTGDASASWRAHRLALGVTEGQAELGHDRILWLETNAAELNGVSFGKGCYVGQENTARMNWRQKVNRRLVVVPLADADPKRQMVAYPSLGLSVEHRRIDAIASSAVPGWMRLSSS
ncbi:MAG: folate-binding protein [Sphingomonadales bacterium]|nr:folate-binding protein [Sphingomonadales bacterium]